MPIGQKQSQRIDTLVLATGHHKFRSPNTEIHVCMSPPRQLCCSKVPM